MKIMKKLGLILFILALGVFIASLGLGSFQFNEQALDAYNDYHKKAITEAAVTSGFSDKTYKSTFSYAAGLKSTIQLAQENQLSNYGAETLADVPEWDFKIGDWVIKDYVSKNVRSAAKGPIKDNPWLFLLLTFGLAIIGGILYVIPMFYEIPGIKNDNIFHDTMTAGLKLTSRSVFLGSTIIGVLIYGFFYMGNQWFFPAVTLLTIGLISFLVLRYKGSDQGSARSASPNILSHMGILFGVFLIGFYILLYWQAHLITNWILIVDPVSKFLSGNPANQWFLYGLMYTVIVIVMGIRMIAKYRHNKYQIIRTYSVIFFQLVFAFLLPEILVRLNQPWFDFKNIWPLNYTFFFDWNIKELIASGGIGIFMLVWGIVLIVIAVPVLTYFFGKRWYCSWVCGCGGLAETMGDPYRQLSDKSLRAWKYERYIIHGVLVFAIVMTIMVLASYFSGNPKILLFDSNSVRAWYGFLIGSAFAGVVGTGFYPLMGNRVWCRFGCPLAAYLGLVQRFKSRFRITTNGGQCISCGNCSTYCEMGIDVRHYAQRGQDIIRSSCVGCGVCSAVCPRGVLRLENSATGIEERASALKTIHIWEDQVKMLG